MHHDSLASHETNLGSEEEGVKPAGQSQFLPLYGAGDCRGTSRVKKIVGGLIS